MSERCACGCMDAPDYFGQYDLCPIAEAHLEEQAELAEALERADLELEEAA